LKLFIQAGTFSTPRSKGFSKLSPPSRGTLTRGYSSQEPLPPFREADSFCHAFPPSYAPDSLRICRPAFLLAYFPPLRDSELLRSLLPFDGPALIVPLLSVRILRLGLPRRPPSFFSVYGTKQTVVLFLTRPRFPLNPSGCFYSLSIPSLRLDIAGSLAFWCFVFSLPRSRVYRKFSDCFPFHHSFAV